MPTKKKVIETEPEPEHTEQPESARTASLLVSANANYCKYLLKQDHVLFRDTLMFQTRIYQYEHFAFLSFHLLHKTTQSVSSRRVSCELTHLRQEASTVSLSEIRIML